MTDQTDGPPNGRVLTFDRETVRRPATDLELDQLERTDPLQSLEARRTRAIVGAVEALQDVVVEQRQEASGERDAETAVVVKGLEEVADAVDALRQTVEQRLPFHDWQSVLITLARTTIVCVAVLLTVACVGWMIGAPMPAGVTFP